MKPKTLFSSFPLSLVKVTDTGVKSLRMVLFRLVAMSFTIQEQNGVHLILSLGIWKIEAAIMLEMWETAQ